MSKFKSSFLGMLGLMAVGELSANVDISCFDYGYNRAPENYGFFGFVDYLYLQPDLRILWETKVTTDLPRPYKVDLKQVPFDWNSGVRIGGGFQAPCDRWSIAAEWMHICSKVAHRDKGVQVNGRGTNVVPGIGFIQQPLELSNSSVDFLARIRYDDVQILLGKEYYTGCSMLLTPFAGVKALFIHSFVQNNFTGSGNFNSQPISYFQNINCTNTFKGVGLTAGLKTSWNLYSGLFFYGMGSASLVYSRTHLELTDNDTNPNFIPLKYKRTLNELTYTLDGSLGFKWIQPIMCNQYMITAHVGWEGHFVSDQNKYPVPSSMLQLPSKPLTIHGLVVGIGIDL